MTYNINLLKQEVLTKILNPEIVLQNLTNFDITALLLLDDLFQFENFEIALLDKYFENLKIEDFILAEQFKNKSINAWLDYKFSSLEFLKHCTTLKIDLLAHAYQPTRFILGNRVVACYTKKMLTMCLKKDKSNYDKIFKPIYTIVDGGENNKTELCFLLFNSMSECNQHFDDSGAIIFYIL